MYGLEHIAISHLVALKADLHETKPSPRIQPLIVSPEHQSSPATPLLSRRYWTAQPGLRYL